jgi:hypothetical protein
MKRTRALLLATSIIATGAVRADQTDVFFRNPVYAIGPSMEACMLIPFGVPASLWGNRERVEQTEVVSQNGRMLTLTGKHEDQTITTYRFFLKRDECLQAMSAPAKRAWYVAKLNFDSCMPSMSPADRIRQIQDAGFNAKTRDVTSASGSLISVEVSYEDGNGEQQLWTYYRSERDCLASLPKNHTVAPKYE